MKSLKRLIVASLFTLCGFVVFAQNEHKIGIIGLDTSHSLVFTRFLNGDNKMDKYKNFKIVAAYPYGSKTIKSSYERIPGYIDQVEALGVEIVSSIPELLEKVDYVLLETNDGNMHLEQANEVFKAGKIVFIDKPLGANLSQAIAIYELSKKYDIPFFTSSALRYVEKNLEIRNGEFGKVLGADCYSPHSPEPSHSDFGWYGIHGVEMLFTVMGTGCLYVNRMTSDSIDVVVGRWENGRIGSFRGLQQGESIYGGTAFTSSGAVSFGPYQGYEGLMDEIINFFKTHTPPISEKETLEIFTFMEASNESVRKNGEIISMEETFEKGFKNAKKLLKKLK